MPEKKVRRKPRVAVTAEAKNARGSARFYYDATWWYKEQQPGDRRKSR